MTGVWRFSPGVSRLGDSRQDAWHPAPRSLLCQCHTSTLLNNLLHHRATITKVTQGGCHRRTLRRQSLWVTYCCAGGANKAKGAGEGWAGGTSFQINIEVCFVQSDGGKKSGSEIIEHISEIKQTFEFGLKERRRNRVKKKK